MFDVPNGLGLGFFLRRTSPLVRGYNAVPAQKPVNVAMYAAGGAVAGAVVGAGAMKLSIADSATIQHHSPKKGVQIAPTTRVVDL